MLKLTRNWALQGRSADLLSCSLFLLFGLAYYTFYLKTPDWTLDATYREFARFWGVSGFYGFSPRLSIDSGIR